MDERSFDVLLLATIINFILAALTFGLTLRLLSEVL
jgi:hypothetical protein